MIYVEVWNTSATSGYAEIYNVTANTAVVYALTAPSGTKLVGNSIEWISERPGVGGGLATLTNYIFEAWPYGLAWNYKSAKPTYYWQGGYPTTGFSLITMLDNNHKGISTPIVENADFVLDHNYGSSY